MPSGRRHGGRSTTRRAGWFPALLVMVCAEAPSSVSLYGAELEVPTVRSREVALHYRLNGASDDARVRLWYTRDRGATWREYDVSDQQGSPLRFIAPAEGLYGFYMAALDGDRSTGEAPEPSQTPQWLIFVDYTPPLVQWEGIETTVGFESDRRVQLRWRAFDNQLNDRPITLWYQSSIDQQWVVIGERLPNTGRYDWRLPEGLSGQVSVRLAVRDAGGHLVERVYGPVPVDRFFASGLSAAPAATQPATDRPSAAVVSAPQPSTRPAGPVVDPETARAARRMYEQGRWHLGRGQYAVAAERFREAFEQDPTALNALNDLAGVLYLQNRYDQAEQTYQSVLEHQAGHLDALRGAFLAAVARKRYPESRDYLLRLLDEKETDAQGWLDLGDVLFMMGEHSRARDSWNKAATVDPKADAIVLKAGQRLKSYAAPALGKVQDTETASATKR